MKKHTLFIILIVAAVLLIGVYVLFFNSTKVKDSPFFIQQVKSYSTSQIDTLKFPNCSLKDYNLLTDYAIKLLSDKKSNENSLKGEVLLSVLANHLTKRIIDGDLDYRSKDLKTLEERYANYQFYINQRPINDFLKVAHHACEGNFEYIYSRFKVKKYFIPVIVLSILFVVFSLLVVCNFIKWKHRQVFTKTFFGFIVILIILIIVFKKTCNNCVTDDSFYGISL